MNVASRELCEELYKLSGWELADMQDIGWNDFWWNWLISKRTKKAKCVELAAHRSNAHWAFGCPAYDLGELLRRLPERHRWLDYSPAQKKWVMLFDIEADTPEDAAAKLAIELFKTGTLTREGEK